MIHWIVFASGVVVMYICIALIGKLTGGSSTSVFDAIRKLFTPTPLLLIIAANSIFAVALFYGFQVSSNVLTIAVAIGVIVSYLFSVFVLGTSITLAKIIGIVLVLIGVYLLR